MNRAWLLIGSLTLALGSAQAEQTRIPDYTGALELFWSELYTGAGETLYCGQAFGAHRGREVNVEHVFPMAWVMNELGCRTRDQCRHRSERFNRIEADLHNLYPALREINEARRSFSFAELKHGRRVLGGCDFEVDVRRRQVEPRPAARGEIARAMFYMHESYELPIFKRLGILLKRWNRGDPPSDEERRRNDRIEALQGNRNRFIDEPGAGDRLRF